MLGLIVSGLVIRLCLVAYGNWQDNNMAVKFTDIDYHVFNDAAEFMSKGESPYLRATYRYTPLLAWLLQPNIWISPLFGKLLFILFDILTGYLTYKITLSGGSTVKCAKVCAAVWLFNPLSMTVSCRGNAESIMSFLVLLCVKLLQDKKIYSAAFVYALSVHVKIYPITYALPIYLLLGNDYRNGDVVTVTRKNWKEYLYSLLPTLDRLKFILTGAVTIGSLTTMYYNWYGMEFLHPTYLYHITRKDIRHNFSVYFYMLYQQSAVDSSVMLGLLSFVPQVVLLVLFSMKYYKHIPLVFFLNTFAFVTFNKVCTSQYFLWYLCLLPLLVPNLSTISYMSAGTALLGWVAGQGVWLLTAYYLEFKGRNTFLSIWVAGLAFFLANCYVLYTLIDNYTLHIPRHTDGNTAASKSTTDKNRRKQWDINTITLDDNSHKHSTSTRQINKDDSPAKKKIVTRSQTRKRNS